jgi:methylmalonyl-CoA/ethylmalonyl-CoA epimerase
MFKRIDHVAVIVEDLDQAIQSYQRAFGVDFHTRERNEEQGFELAIFDVGDAHFEILSPTREDSVIAGVLKKRGPGIHHIGLEVEGITDCMEMVRAEGFSLTSPEPRRGSGDSLINFIHPRDTFGSMLEMVEVKKHAKG